MCWCMETGGHQHNTEQEQGAVAGLVAANKVSSADHRRERVDVVEICLDEGISVVSAYELRTKTVQKYESPLQVLWRR